MSRRNKTKDQALVVASNTSVSDAFSNPMYRLGFGTQAPLEATEYPLTRMTDNYAKLNSMYRSGGILQSVVDIIPNDMIKEWFNLNGEISPEEHADIDRVIRKTLLREKLIDGLKWGRLYGGAAGLILIKGQENSLDQPLELDSIMPNSYKGLMIMDRWQGITPNMGLVTDMSDPDFGLPEYYEISTGDGRVIAAKVHHSRIVRFIGRKLPFLEELAEVYWGESEIEPIYDDIVLYDNIMHNMGNLTFRANLDTMEVQNLDQLFAATSTEQQKRFWNVMQAQSVAKSNFGIQLINKGDQIHNQQYAFTGFDHVTEAAQLNLSAKTHIPMTKLFGRSPAGLSSTGEGDLRNYYDIVDGERESKLRPVLERILPIICMSAIGKVPEDLDIMFPSLWTPNATEIADIASKKTSTIISAFQAGMINLGPAQQELKKLSDETGMFESIPDDQIESNMDVTYQEATAVADPMAGLFGGRSRSREEEKEEVQTQDFNPNHDPDNGQFSEGPGGSASSGKEAKLADLQDRLKTATGIFQKAAIRTEIEMIENGFEGTKEEYLQQKKEKREEASKKQSEERSSKEKQKAEKEAALKKTIQEEMKTQPKEKVDQFKIIQETNPMLDDYHVGIRKPSDIKTWKEVLSSKDDESFTWGDFSRKDAEKAMKSGKITLYSSKPIDQGNFVSTSKTQAEQYAGGSGKKIYSKTVPLESVAWINGDEGVFADLSK